jgi:rhodanese-related sulfurtransferase
MWIPFAPGHKMKKTVRELKKRRNTFHGPTGALVFILALALFWSWLPALGGQPSTQGKVLHLNAQSLDLLLESDPNLLLVDVREPDELTGPLGRIPQSQNVPMGELEKNPEQFPRNKTLVLICRTGYRSLDAADLLAEHGYVAYSVDGGMQSWRRLHPLTSLPAEGGSQKAPGAPGQAPDKAKPLPPKNGDQHQPEKFFGSDMGC